MKTGFVVIGRNEGKRLQACLASLPVDAACVYVDSGSTDGSVMHSREAGATVVELDMAVPFTAARARNEGWRKLLEQFPDIRYVHFLDGDCELCNGWLAIAESYLIENSEYAVACGRRKEKYPQASIYNTLCDIEWNTPVGDAKACGGDALFRLDALQEVSGYNPSLIAGEEPELCIRLRACGYKVRRIDHDMTSHDAALTHFSQWWKRSVRCGYAYALGASLHGGEPERHCVAETRRAIVWGMALPLLMIALGLVVSPWLFAGFLIYPAQWLRLTRKSPVKQVALYWASFSLLSKFSEAWGVLKYYFNHLFKKQAVLIEYK